ncbi:MAG TPA: nucleoside monophosphate kinase [Patescibacteria group bacterium]|nr:nucleoside monophosphate kinase [Patescibacteria group bacterium]
MIVLLFGAPGTGKSTYAKYISDKMGLTWISTGALFRQIAQSDSRIRSLLDSGQLIPDEEVNAVLFGRLSETGGNFILDGFPRTTRQAESFQKFLQERGWKIDLIFHLQVPVQVIVSRMTGRGRADDTVETIKDRFEIFEKETAPVLGYFKAQGVTAFEIDNSPPQETVKKKFDQFFT